MTGRVVPFRRGLGDTGPYTSPGSVLMGDPTFGTRSVIEQAADVNGVLDPGMSFGTPPASGVEALTPDQLQSVGVGAATAMPVIGGQNAPAATAIPPWVKPVLITGGILLAVWLLNRGSR